MTDLAAGDILKLSWLSTHDAYAIVLIVDVRDTFGETSHLIDVLWLSRNFPHTERPSVTTWNEGAMRKQWRITKLKSGTCT